ncbi:hypothetical protein [Cronobacter sakazakii]|uniref:hypothetical protein n=1 Tax=Cronobacter sakazakii TaxID=28141 RepID=UPI000A19191C|nr:hypothetical protein [Cronobacter sakazakii]ELY5775174.1 hypothetical protein [Cronobacter sakazakii]KAB1030195.1 hypothetical protein AUM50_15400 [Cronobacter sakazakii]MCI0192147.1 hypothetical protein [Cronobacter sakazakii]MCI0209084.1 hypothetical protein [Cronobacter sakazakii]MCI0273274.1 hypothetical protein [Cronobacter sakazakii]
MSDATNEQSQDARYCPFCQRHIEPARDDLGVPYRADDGGFIYVHDPVMHDDEYTFTPLN